jgi:hypothetical protein
LGVWFYPDFKLLSDTGTEAIYGLAHPCVNTVNLKTLLAMLVAKLWNLLVVLCGDWLTPWNRIFLEEVYSFRAGQEVCFYGTWRFRNATIVSYCKLNLVYIFTLYFPEIHFNNIHLSVPIHCKWDLPCRVSY